MDDITSLKFSSDGLILLSRSLDGSLKVLLQCSERTYHILWIFHFFFLGIQIDEETFIIKHVVLMANLLLLPAVCARSGICVK